MTADPMQHLISLPPAAAALFAEVTGRQAPEWFAAADPEGRRVGSGGGTAHLLVEAWRATGEGASFPEWLRGSRKLVLHGGGHSRRLPAYAPVGKPFIPMPVQRGSYGQRLDQTLLDLQLPCYRKVLGSAPEGTVAMVASGDVLIQLRGELPPMPEADVILVGMRVPPETACHFGVFFTPLREPARLAFSLQKPPVERIERLSEEHQVLVDTGLWLLGERAVAALLARCCWDPAAGFPEGIPEVYELYAQMGPSLGERPEHPDPLIADLSCAVVELEDAEFYHLGTSRQMIESVCALQNSGNGKRKVTLSHGHTDQITQNSVMGLRTTDYGLRTARDAQPRVCHPERDRHPERSEGSPLSDRRAASPGACNPISTANRTLWIENSVVPASWALAHDHVLTGVPENRWNLSLEPGVCLDFVPVDEDALCIRAYGMDDTFGGPLANPATTWLGRPAQEWLSARGIAPGAAGIAEGSGIHDAPLFPVLRESALDGEFVAWLFAAAPERSEAFTRRWLECERLSASGACARANLRRLWEGQAENRRAALQRIFENRRTSVFPRLDLGSTARLADGTLDLLTPAPSPDGEPLRRMREGMWRAAILRRQGKPWEAEEASALAALREALLAPVLGSPAEPAAALLPDQIVWARAPVRLDLAGGWTDTPPYCIEHGGRVVNLAADLNGQPPVQVFAKLSARPEIVIRSIDRGVDERIATYEELGDFAHARSDFALARAGLALAGFLPRFSGGRHTTLREQLEAFGGGIEVSLLAAVPQGSGLGTSSILAAALLAALNEVCGLHWDPQAVVERTLALEQMLTTGGGWQDQAGGIFPGAKLVETAPGLPQTLSVRWLPDRLFSPDAAGSQVLLYYTGLTRLAHGILGEVVRGVLLNSPAHLGILRDIGGNAASAADAIQRADWSALCASVRRSWELNQRLDGGTSPPPVQAILGRVGDYLDGAKLLGAGGGGYLLMLAKDPDAALRVRRLLDANPPAPGARFTAVALSGTGLAVTRS